MDETYTPPQKDTETTQDPFADIQEMQTSDIAKRAQRLEAVREAEAIVAAEEAKLKARRTAVVVGTSAIVAAVGIAGIASMEGGNSNGAERGELDNTIETITLNQEANLRFDPYVGEGEDNNNVLHLDAPITIDVDHDIRVLEGTNNGTWYGIPVDHVEAVIPNLDDRNDKDQILWVNEQGVSGIDRTELPTLESSDQ